MRRIDAWIGSRLFVPVIIWICQRARITQQAFHNYGWMLATWVLLYATGKKDMGSIGLTLAIATYFTFMAARAPDRATRSSLWVRAFFFLGETIHFGRHVLHEAGLVDGPFLLWGTIWDTSCAVGLMLLAAEYAATIKTIPPLSAAKRSASHPAWSAK